MWHSVDDVAERLGLHVRTVRGYIRDGRLAAVRIGKQYRIAQADLDAFTGRPARRPAEVSAVVEFEGLSRLAADRVSTLVVAGAQTRPLRVQAVYDDDRGRLRVIVFGGLAETGDLLRMLHDVTETENGIG